jgi:hypothetical protein
MAVKKTKEQTPVKVVEQKKVKPKFIKKKYLLKKDVSTSNGIKKKGTSIELTKEGRDYFKQKLYI